MNGEEKKKSTPKYPVGTEIYLAEDGTGPVTVTAVRTGPGGATQYRTTANPRGAWLDEGALVLRPAATTAGGGTILQQRPGARDPEDWAADFAVALPPALQTVLVRDAHAREVGGPAPAAPRAPPGRDALDAYARHMERLVSAGTRIPLHSTTSNEEGKEEEEEGVAADHYRDVIATLRVLFDCYLCPCLLYACEQPAHRRAFPPASRRRPSNVYGCVYLLRLCAALPAVAAVADATLAPAARPVFVAHVQHLLDWLAENQTRYFPQQS